MRTVLLLVAVSAAVAVGFWPLPTCAADALSDASIKGTYSFRFYGQDFNTFPSGVNNQIAATGVFTANGAGAITGGSLSYNDGGELCIYKLNGGTYSVSSDGEGSLNLASTISPTGTCPLLVPFEFYIAVGDIVGGVAHIVELGSNYFTGSTGTSTPHVPVSGVADFQTPLPCANCVPYSLLQ